MSRAMFIGNNEDAPARGQASEGVSTLATPRSSKEKPCPSLLGCLLNNAGHRQNPGKHLGTRWRSTLPSASVRPFHALPLSCFGWYSSTTSWQSKTVSPQPLRPKHAPLRRTGRSQWRPSAAPHVAPKIRSARTCSASPSGDDT